MNTDLKKYFCTALLVTCGLLGRVHPCLGAGPATPIVLRQETLGLDAKARIQALAVNDSGMRIYLGLGYSYSPKRFNLVVVSVDPATRLPVGLPRRYHDGTEQLPASYKGRRASSVFHIALDGSHRKLYLAAGWDMNAADGDPGHSAGVITVYDLDATGEPIGAPRAYRLDDRDPDAGWHVPRFLALHPGKPVLYTGGDAGMNARADTLFSVTLDANREPTRDPSGNTVATGMTIPGATRLITGVVGSDGKSVYVGSPNKLYTVDANMGKINAGLALGLPVAQPDFVVVEGFGNLYLRPPIERTVAGAPWTSAVVDLPSGPTVLGKGWLVGNDAYTGDLWMATDNSVADFYTKSPVTTGFSVTEYLGSTVPAAPWPMQYRRVAVAMAASTGTPVFPVVVTAAGNTTAVNYSGNWSWRATVRRANAQGVTRSQLTLTDPCNHSAVIVKPNVPSNWRSLDGCLKSASGQVRVPFGFNDKALDLLDVHLEIAQGPPATAAITGLDETVVGDVVLTLLPAYTFGPAPARAGAMEIYSGHVANHHLAKAREVGLHPGEPAPTRLLLSANQLIGGQGQIDQLTNSVVALQLLGFNLVSPTSWGRLVPDRINAVLNKYGFTRRVKGVLKDYPITGVDAAGQLNGENLPRQDYLIADLGSKLQPRLPAKPDPDPKACSFVLANDDFGARLGEGAQSAWTQDGGARGTVAEVLLADEPMGIVSEKEPQRQSVLMGDLARSPSGMAAFRCYLQKVANVTPGDLGVTGWADPCLQPMNVSLEVPANCPARTDLARRRLYYHTVQYVMYSFTQAYRMQRAEIESYFHDPARTGSLPPMVAVNMSDSGYFHWYGPAVAKEPHLAGFVPDPMRFGRQKGAALWTEDFGFKHRDAQFWSWTADLLRSASLACPGCAIADLRGAQRFGSHFRATEIDDIPDGFKYRLFALLGHGAKAASIYNFGPRTFTSDGWSERDEIYGPIADAFRMAGRAERLLYPGVPARGRVAIMLPGSSYLWDGNGTSSVLYLREIIALHHALAHEGYTVDFVDETDLSDARINALGTRRYSVLYVTQPDVSRAAQAKIDAWVKAGGTLAVTAGAAVADEFDQATAILDPVIGLKPRASDRRSLATAAIKEAFVPEMPERLVAAAPRCDNGVVEPPRTLRCADDGCAALPTLVMAAADPATPLLRSSTGAVVATQHAYGKGRAYAYAFHPGIQYWLSPDRSDLRHFPREWEAGLRWVAVAPATCAKTARPVILDRPIVEALRLDTQPGDTERGTAVVLLNWTDDPIDKLGITVPDLPAIATVTSTATGGPVRFEYQAPTLRLSVPLAHVDVLLIDYK